MTRPNRPGYSIPPGGAPHGFDSYPCLNYLAGRKLLTSSQLPELYLLDPNMQKCLSFVDGLVNAYMHDLEERVQDLLTHYKANDLEGIRNNIAMLDCMLPSSKTEVVNDDLSDEITKAYAAVETSNNTKDPVGGFNTLDVSEQDQVAGNLNDSLLARYRQWRWKEFMTRQGSIKANLDSFGSSWLDEPTDQWVSRKLFDVNYSCGSNSAVPRSVGSADHKSDNSISHSDVDAVKPENHCPVGGGAQYDQGIH